MLKTNKNKNGRSKTFKTYINMIYYAVKKSDYENRL